MENNSKIMKTILDNKNFKYFIQDLHECYTDTNYIKNEELETVKARLETANHFIDMCIKNVDSRLKDN